MLGYQPIITKSRSSALHADMMAGRLGETLDENAYGHPKMDLLQEEEEFKKERFRPVLDAMKKIRGKGEEVMT